jgi:hypothetical protein
MRLVWGMPLFVGFLLCWSLAIFAVFLGGSHEVSRGFDLESSDDPGCLLPRPEVVDADGASFGVREAFLHPTIRSSRVEPYFVVINFPELTCNYAAAGVGLRVQYPALGEETGGWLTYIENPSFAGKIAARWGENDPFHGANDNELIFYPGHPEKADLVVVMAGDGQTIDPDHDTPLRTDIVVTVGPRF